MTGAGAVDDLYDETADGAFVVSVRAQPGARTTAVVGRHGDALRVRVGAPPDRGKANAALVAVLAEAFGVGRAQVTLVSGATSRSKRFRLEGIDRDRLRRVLSTLVDP